MNTLFIIQHRQIGQHIADNRVIEHAEYFGIPRVVVQALTLPEIIDLSLHVKAVLPDLFPRRWSHGP